jgi:mono/diheme cytochrome c family protein
MKFKSLIVAAGLCLMASAGAWAAEDGAALFKAKCAPCHGAEGEGKPAMKAPALKGTALSADQIVDVLTKGKEGAKAPHTKAVAGVTADQAKAIADFVKGLK